MSTPVARKEKRPAAEAKGGTFTRSDVIVVVGAVIAVAAAGLSHYLHLGGTVLPFLFSAAAVTLLASLVGTSVEQMGDRFGPSATGVLQSALGNLPELFIALFALKAGLVDVVRAALVGSILANLLLVMGLCFLVGGLRHGTQQLNSERARGIIVLMVLSVSAMVIPSIASYVHTPANPKVLSIIAAVVLIGIFVATLPASLRKEAKPDGAEPAPAEAGEAPRWPLWLAVAMLVVSAGAAAFVSDWFVAALEPAMNALHVSPAFAGLVVVAIAGNAIENVVGVQLAAANRADFAFSVVINSPLQIALVLAPALVVLSSVLGLAPLTLVFSPMLVISLILAILLTAVITLDGESNWTEGLALIGLYGIVAASFWWG